MKLKTRKRSPSEAKTISVYFTEPLHRLLAARAKSEGRSASGHVRFLVQRDAESASAK
jgi:hypothetical protein